MGGERLVGITFEDIAIASRNHPLPSEPWSRRQQIQLNQALKLANNTNYQQAVGDILTAIRTGDNTLAAQLLQDKTDFISSTGGLGIDSAVESIASMAVGSKL